MPSHRSPPVPLEILEIGPLKPSYGVWGAL